MIQIAEEIWPARTVEAIRGGYRRTMHEDELVAMLVEAYPGPEDLYRRIVQVIYDEERLHDPAGPCEPRDGPVEKSAAAGTSR